MKDSYFAMLLLNVGGNWTWSEPEMFKLFAIGKYCLKKSSGHFSFYGENEKEWV